MILVIKCPVCLEEKERRRGVDPAQVGCPASAPEDSEIYQQPEGGCCRVCRARIIGAGRAFSEICKTGTWEEVINELARFRSEFRIYA